MQRSFASSYGIDAGGVRIHADSNAASAAADLRAEAFAFGKDIFFADGMYRPGTQRGDFVIAHEVAHVAQQSGGTPAPQAKLEIGDSDDALEQEADTAAIDALQGRRAAISQGVAKVRCFGAGKVVRTKDLDGKEGWTVKPGGHAEMTVKALKAMGLDDEAACKGYQGNWARDFSQALTPGLVAILQEKGVYNILNLISILEFGRGISASELGTYDPVEHIDNPGDLRGSDVFNQTEGATTDTTATGDDKITIPGWDGPDGAKVGNPDAAGTGLKAGDSTKGYANVDKRYADTANKLREDEGKDLLGKGVDAFKVDSSGIPVYISTSKDWSKKTIVYAATLGSSSPKEVKGSKTSKSGPRELASGLHTLQDYYAHSNFCEVAVNILIRDMKLPLKYADEHGETKTLSGAERKKTLNTGVYKNDKRGEPIKSYNLNLKDLKGFKKGKHENREVIQTGTFNLTDTAVSLLHVAKEKLLALNPFKEKKGPSPLMMAVLDLMDMNAPDQFNKTGEKIASMMRPVSKSIKDIGEEIAGAVSTAGDTAGDIAEGAGDAGGAFFDGLNWVNSKLGGDADYFDDEKKAVVGAGKRANKALDSKSAAAAKKIASVCGWLDKKADEISKKEHILRDLYKWWSGVDLLAPVKALARAIPIVGDKIVKLITDLQEAIKDVINSALKAGWDIAAKKGAAGIQEAIEWVKERTNIEKKKKAGVASPKGPDVLPEEARKLLGEGVAWVERTLGGVGDLYEDGMPKEGIAPPDYTPPSHSEVAKDHHDSDEPGAVTGGKKEHKHDGDDHDDHDHGHPPHEGEWLNPMAEKLATKASIAVAKKVKVCWDAVDRGETAPPEALAVVKAEVDKWFQHPADLRSEWESEIRSKLMDPRIGKYLVCKMKMNARSK